MVGAAAAEGGETSTSQAAAGGDLALARLVLPPERRVMWPDESVAVAVRVASLRPLRSVVMRWSVTSSGGRDSGGRDSAPAAKNGTAVLTLVPSLAPAPAPDSTEQAPAPRFLEEQGYMFVGVYEGSTPPGGAMALSPGGAATRTRSNIYFIFIYYNALDALQLSGTGFVSAESPNHLSAPEGEHQVNTRLTLGALKVCAMCACFFFSFSQVLVFFCVCQRLHTVFFISKKRSYNRVGLMCLV